MTEEEGASLHEQVENQLQNRVQEFLELPDEYLEEVLYLWARVERIFQKLLPPGTALAGIECVDAMLDEQVMWALAGALLELTNDDDEGDE